MDGNYCHVLQSAASSTEEARAGLEVEEVAEEVEQGQEMEVQVEEVAEEVAQGQEMEVQVEEVEEEVQQGQEIGHFSFGSSIVLIFEAPLGLQFTRAPRDEVRLGEYLL